ncbi:Ig-like domain-containing protein, partial [Aliivibrio finisterrensis]|uniref:Ig-like domain-containing protein n=1 Tax=Aliivibrio finisterrensis TaxID=511998 RepID=UPI0013ED4A9E
MRFVLFCAFFLFSTLSSAAAPKLEAIYGLDNDDMYLEGDKLNIVAEFDSFISPSNATSPSSMTIELDTGPDSTFTTLDLDMSTGDIVDKSFGVPNTANTNTPNDNTGIWTAENLSSGDVLLGGSFTSYEGTSTRNLVLVDIDGKVKKTFSFGAEVTAVHETSQGKIIVAGEFVNYDGEGNYDYLVQFNSDFTIDTDFMDNLTANNTQRTFNGIVGEKTRAVQSPDPIVEHNSKLYIAGNFNTVSGQRYSRVVSLNLDGTINTSFSFPILNNTSVAYEYVKSLAIDTNDTADLTDDRLFVVGYDILLNYKGSNTYRPIWKLKLDGSVDESFLSAVTSATIVSGVQVLPDYAMEGVAFSGAGLAGSSSDDFAVLKDDGSFNTDWKTTGIQAGYAADAFIIIERKLFIGAHNGWPAALGNGSLAVFNLDDGTLNQNIMNVLGTGSFDYGYRDVHGLKLLSDGGLLVMGTFRGFDGDNQIDRRSIVKLRLNRLEGTYTVREEAKDLTGKLKVNKITKFSVNNVFGDGLITTIPDVATLSGGTLEENNHYSLNRYPTDPLTSLLTVDKSKTPTTQVIKATVTAKTENDKFVGKSGDVVEILIDNPLIKLSSLTDNKDGTYSVTLSTTETTTQLGNVTAKVDGGYVQNNTSATTTLAVEFTDVLKPSATITTNKASLKKGDTATLSIAVSEVTTDLVITDFTVSGGTLSDFKGSGQDYTVVFTPTVNSFIAGSVTIPVDKFSDLASNLNTASNTLSLSIDTLPPTVAISAASTSLIAGETTTVTITLSESATDFAKSDLTVTGGTLSDFKGSGTSYTVLFTPKANSVAAGKVSIAASSFHDAMGNANEVLTEESLTIDTTVPTIDLSANKTALTVGEKATITIALSENSTNFALGDLDVVGGTLSDFKGSGKAYTVVFTPTANSIVAGKVTVAASKFSDASGNLNAVGDVINFTVDTVAPTITLTPNKTSLKNGETATITIALSEIATDFVLADLTVVGGTLSSFTGKDKAYTVLFTPTENSVVAGKVTVAANKFSDASGNTNAVGDVVNFTVDTVTPTVSLTSIEDTLLAGETTTILITLSEAATDFVLADLKVSGGKLSDFKGSGKDYTVVFTPTVDSTIAGNVNIAVGSFNDAAGNSNKTGASIDFTVDTLRPTVTDLDSDKDPLSSGNTATITIKLSENATDFALGDLQATNGTLSDLKGKDKTYTVVFTPKANSVGTGVVTVSASSFSDALGNKNLAATSLDINIDTAGPTVSLSGDKSKVIAGETLTVTFDLNEKTIDFTQNDLSVVGGSLSGFTGKDKKYSVVFTPTVNSTKAGSVTVAASSFSDALGNMNALAKTINFTVDTLVPTINLTADKSTLKQGETAAITIVLSEVATDLTKSDFTVVGGVLSDFKGSDKNYTALYTPTSSSISSGSITVSANRFTDPSGNNNAAGDSVSFSIDTAAPSVSSLTTDKSELIAGSAATITINLSEASTDFTKDDLVIIGGSISDFKGTGKVYTVVFTPQINSVAAGKVSVSASSFTDASGNTNTAGKSLDLTIDTILPTLKLTADKQNLIIGDTATITATFSEEIEDFYPIGLTVKGGALGTITGTGKVYTVVYTPAKGSTGAGSVKVGQNSFDDLLGNFNTVEETLGFTIDTEAPTISITANKTKLAVGETATLSFALSESATDFVQSDITIVGGTISNFSGSGKSYTAVYTPTASANGATGKISVAANSFNDPSGNSNAAGDSIDFVIDTLAPTISMTANKTQLVVGDTATITIVLSEAATDFALVDLSVSGGALSSFTGKDKNYSVVFTPSANTLGSGVVSVTADHFSDAAGNKNKTGDKVDFTIDTVIPTITMSADKSSVGSGDTSTIAISLNEDSINFVQNDLTVTGGTLSQFTGKDKDYSVVFTPTTNSTTAGTVTVAANAFSDKAGNLNAAGASVSYTVDTVAPTITMSSTKSSLSSGESATVSIKLSEIATDFKQTDLKVSGGTLSNFTGKDKTYSVLFTPTTGSTGTGTITVNANSFTDPIGNNNTTVEEIEFTTDTVIPTISMRADKSVLIAGETAKITIHLNKATTDFIENDLTVVGGTLSDFKGSDKDYTAVFTPTTDSIKAGKVSAAAGVFHDSIGNSNVAGAFVDFTIDTAAPTAQITADKNSLIRGDTANISITLSDAAINFTLLDMLATGGTLSDFKGTGKKYTAVFTATNDATGIGSVEIRQDSFSDIAGNLNKVTPSVNFNIDTVLPTVSLVADKTTLIVGDTATVTITLSENSITFTKSDLVVIGGTLSDFKGSGNKYTVVFTPLKGQLTNESITVEADSFTDLAGNKNADEKSVNFTVDIVPPTISLSPDKSTLSVGDTATITITLSETATDFALIDMSANGGSLSDFKGSGKSYTVVFTPSSGSSGVGKVTVNANSFKDTAGNLNAVGDSVSFTLDTVTPTISMTANKTSLKTGDTALITIKLSEASINFVKSDLSVTGGSLSDFKGTGKDYTVTFTPSSNSTTAGEVKVERDKFSDVVGNNNAVGASIDFIVDTVVPTITMSANSTDLSAGETATLTITLSETATDFALSDLSATGGTLSTFTGSGTSYTVVFTPTAGSNGAGKVTVAQDSFSDAKGNKNAAGSSVDFTIDTVVPTISMTANSTDLAVGDTATITITLSEASTNFV